MRELHDQLSRYVHHVAAGGEVVVTTRGRPVARLVPVSDGDPFESLRARGLLREPVRPKRPAHGRPRVTASGSVSELVSEQRR